MEPGGGSPARRGSVSTRSRERLEGKPRITLVSGLVGYLERNAHRMEYPEYLAHGWCIGSGAVESACKTVVGQRLKLAGMRWGEAGADAVCHLRALFRNEKTQWDDYWASLAA